MCELKIKLGQRTIVTTNELVRTLREVQRLGSMSKAGENLFLTIPAVKYRLDLLSRRVGGAVVEQTRFTGTKLTALGRRVCREWQDLEPTEAVAWDLERRYPQAAAVLRQGGRRVDVMRAQKVGRGVASRICRQWREAYCNHSEVDYVAG